MTLDSAAGSRHIARSVGCSHSTVQRIWRRRKINRIELAEQNALIVAHRDLARNIARNIAKTVPASLEADLIGAANTGLVQAARAYRSDVQGAGHAQPVSFGAFAVRRIRGACLDSIRRRKFRDSTSDELPRDESEARPDHNQQTAEANVIEREQRSRERARVTRAILSLPGRLAVVTWLHHFEGKSIVRVAEQLGVDASRVSQLHTEALGLMREALLTSASRQKLAHDAVGMRDERPQFPIGGGRVSVG